MRGRLDGVPRRATLALVLGVLVVGTTWPVVSPLGGNAQVAEEGTVVGRPVVALSVPDNRVGAGERVSLGVLVANNADLDRGGPAQFEDRVTTARNVELRILESELAAPLAGSLEVQTGTVLAGQVPAGVAGPFTFDLVVAPDLPPGRYSIPVEVSYEFTNVVQYSDVDGPEYRDTSRQVVEELTLVVEERPRIEVSMGDDRSIERTTDAVELLVSNTGSAVATDVGVRLQVGGGVLYFGGGDDKERHVGTFVERLAPGTSRTLTVTVSAWSRANRGTYLLTANVTYQSSPGVDRTAGPFRMGVVVNLTG